MGVSIKIPIEELRKRKLFLATPMYGGNCSGMFARSVADLAAMCANHGIQLQLYFLFNESLITRARAYCTDEFLRSKATHLMFIDSDIGFDPRDVLALMSMQGDDSEYDVIGGPYPKKCISWEKIKMAVDKGCADENPNLLDRYVGDYVFNPKSGSSSIPIGQPVEVREIGTGFMMIRRKTLEKFREAYPFLMYKPDHVRTEHFDGSREILMAFDCIIDRGYEIGDLQDVVRAIAEANDDLAKFSELQKKAKELLAKEEKASKRYLSEDYNFCYLCDKAGLKVWLCPWVKLQHVGTYVFGGSLADLAALGAAATADPAQMDKIKDYEKQKKKKKTEEGKKK